MVAEEVTWYVISVVAGAGEQKREQVEATAAQG